MFAAVGTTSISAPRYSIPPSLSRSPRRTSSSASLRQGAWRPAHSGGRSGDEAAGDADVIPGRLLPVGVPEQGGRMVRNDNRDTPEPVQLVAEGTQRLLRIEERLRRRPAHREDHLRLQELDLAEQVR